MPQPTGSAHGPGGTETTLGRRTLLTGMGAALGLVGLSAAAGCSGGAPGGATSPGGPRASGSTSARAGGSGSPTPGSGPSTVPPIAGAAIAISTETRLCAVAAGILAKTGDDAPSGRQRTILTQIRDAHLDHLQALHAQPSLPSHPANPASPRAAKVAGDLSEAIGDLVSLESAAAGQHRGRLRAAAPADALVWASLSTAADSFAAALKSDRSRSATVLGRQRQAQPDQTQALALAALVAQLHAALYGYQTAVPKLSGDAATTALNRITAIYRLRDGLSAELVRLKATPPAAAPAYVLNPRPTNATSAGRLLAGIETRLQPFLGQWVAASTGNERLTAAAALTTTARTALNWGGALNRWPGWA